MKRIGIILITILSFLLITFAGVYFFGVFYFRHWFCPNTYVNGVNVTNKNFNVLDTLINESVVNHNLVIEDSDGTQIFIDGSEIYSYNYDEIGNAIQYIKDSQNPYLWVKCIFEKHEYVYSPKRYLDDKKLMQIVLNSKLGQKDRFDPKRRAEIKYTKERGYELIDDTQNLLDWELLNEIVMSASVEDVGYINLKEAGVYKSIERSEEEKKIISDWGKLEKTLDFNMTYKLATGEEITVDSAVISQMLLLDENGDFVFEDGEAVIDSEKVLAFVQDMSDKYDNLYKDKYFDTTSGGTVTIPYTRYTTYGSLMNVKAEAEELEALIKSHKSPGEREPIYIKKEDRGTYANNYGGTYVEVDITNQHMYYYVNNNLVFDTEVVTGCKANGNMTPDCVCFILNKARNVTLIGPGYESFVYYWMCITGQIGIHDATWRRTFGGEIYLWGGSHGCINTPLNKMSELYDMMEIGTPVIVHHYEPPVVEEDEDTLESDEDVIEDSEDTEETEEVTESDESGETTDTDNNESSEE